MGVKSVIINFLFRKGFMSKKWKSRFAFFGENSEIEYPSVLQDVSKTHIGNNTTILRGSRLQNYSDKNATAKEIVIGNNCYIGFGVSILNAGSIRIDDEVLIASNVLISSENHGMNPESIIPYMDQPLDSKDVHIEKGVWIGQNVCILPGVSVGEKAIIGAGSVVTKSVPSYSIAVGNPAKIIKKYNFDTHLWEKC